MITVNDAIDAIAQGGGAAFQKVILDAFGRVAPDFKLTLTDSSGDIVPEGLETVINSSPDIREGWAMFGMSHRLHRERGFVFSASMDILQGMTFPTKKDHLYLRSARVEIEPWDDRPAEYEEIRDSVVMIEVNKDTILDDAIYDLLRKTRHDYGIDLAYSGVDEECIKRTLDKNFLLPERS